MIDKTCSHILIVDDVYDAVASARPYRPAMPHAACLDLLRADAAGGGLDPEIVRCFTAIPAFLPAGMPAVRRNE